MRTVASGCSDSIIEPSTENATKRFAKPVGHALACQLCAYGIAVVLSAFLATRSVSSQISFFQNRTSTSGIHFRLENSPSDEKYLIETMTGGCAFLDYDGDGLLDVF